VAVFGWKVEAGLVSFCQQEEIIKNKKDKPPRHSEHSETLRISTS